MKAIQQYIILGIAIILLGGAYLLDSSNQEDANLEKYAKQIEQYLKKNENAVIEIFENDELIEQLLHEQYQANEWAKLNEFSNERFALFIYDENDSLRFWSTNKIKPAIEEVRSTSVRQFKLIEPNDSRFELIKEARIINGKKRIIVGLIPIYYEFDIENEHIDNHFALAGHIPETVIISDEETPHIVEISNSDKVYLTSEAPFTDYTMKVILMFLYGFGFIFLGAFINRFALKLSHNKSPIYGFSFLMLSIFILRYLTLSISVNTVFDDIVLFQSKEFIAPIISGSVMGLLINTVLVLWLVTFFFREVPLKKPTDYSQATQFSIVFGSYSLIFLAILWLNNIIRDLVLVSKISFDFDNVFKLDSNSFLGLISISLLALALFLFSHKVVRNAIDANINTTTKGRISIILSLIAIALSSFGIMGWNISFLFLFAVGYIALFEFFIEDKKSSLQWLGGWLFTYSVFITTLLLYFNVEKEHIQRVSYADRLAMKRDFQTEEEFQRVEEKIKLDNSIKNLANPLYPNTLMVKTIEEINEENQYIKDNYEISVSVFDRNGKIKEGTEISYEEINAKIELADTTISKNLHFWSDETKNAYIAHIPIINMGRLAGNVVVQYEPKNLDELNVYPELLTDRSLATSSGLDYDYAIYKNGKKIKEKGKSYESTLNFDLPKGETKQRFTKKDKRTFLIYKADSNKTIVVGKDQNEPFQPISSFSYVFVFLSIILLIISSLSRITSLLPKSLSVSFTPQPSLRNRIQVAVIAVIVLTFFTIGLVTFFYFSADSDEYHSSRLGRKARGVLASTQYWMTVNAKDSTYILDVDALAKIHRLDINLFGEDGELIKASQPEIFNKGLVARQMPPIPYFNMKMQGLTEYTDRESVGTLEYRVAYRKVENANKEIVGYLGLPYYSERSDFNEDIADFIGTLLNVYVALLIIAFIAAFATAESITRPLSKLREKLQAVELGKKNEQLEWDSKDEIGGLIEEYNKMLIELERSASKLATSEREGAWREMAKQVAHEIKNPLTPMKLSIQYLVRAYKSRPDEIEPMLNRVSKTLVEQIDSLSRIATEFSNFAKMPKAENEYLNINSLVSSIYTLFSENDRVNMELEMPAEDLTVFADKEQLIRVFNNITKNAIQAVPEEEQADIKIKLYENYGNAVVAVTDNGVGIPEDKRQSLFVPYFTTKNSGTGLGLAISRKIIEQAGGTINFESEVGIGTTFYIELPAQDRPTNGVVEEFVLEKEE